MSAFLNDIGTFFDTSIGWMGDVLDVVVASPALTVLVLAMPIISFAIGIFQRLIRS